MRPVIDQVLPFEEAMQAYRYFRDGIRSGRWSSSSSGQKWRVGTGSEVTAGDGEHLQDDEAAGHGGRAAPDEGAGRGADERRQPAKATITGQVLR
jgi:hypothetical protein